MNKALLKSSVFFLLLSVFILESAIAQVYNREGLEYRKWRVSLFPPLSTNGVNAPDYTANTLSTF